MRAFVVHLNGKLLCTAGIGNNGVLTAMADWCGSPRSHRELPVNFTVGGLDSNTNEDVEWVQLELADGDEVCIRVVETDKVDTVFRKGRSEVT
jgi:hypothetical protein